VRVKARVSRGGLRIVPAKEPVAAGAALVAAVRAGCVDGAVPALEWQPGPEVSGGDYDDMFHRFVAAATESGDDS